MDRRGAGADEANARRLEAEAEAEAARKAAELAKPKHILGAGLSGLSAATILARAGCEVHVHEIRSDSGARFDGDFQGIENPRGFHRWTPVPDQAVTRPPAGPGRSC